jgi:hypothetical protein
MPRDELVELQNYVPSYKRGPKPRNKLPTDKTADRSPKALAAGRMSPKTLKYLRTGVLSS